MSRLYIALAVLLGLICSLAPARSAQAQRWLTSDERRELCSPEGRASQVDMAREELKAGQKGANAFDEDAQVKAFMQSIMSSSELKQATDMRGSVRVRLDFYNNNCPGSRISMAEVEPRSSSGSGPPPLPGSTSGPPPLPGSTNMPPPLPAGDTPPRDEDGLMAVLSAEEREAYEQLPEGARNALLQQLNQSSGTTGAGPPPLPSGKPPQAPQDQLRGKAQFQDLSPALQEALLDRAEKKLERKPRLSLEERLERLPEDQRQEVLDELGEVPE